VTEEWVPFGLDEDAASQYRVLEDGVPQRMREPLVGWLSGVLRLQYGVVNVPRVHALEMVTDVSMGGLRASDTNMAVSTFAVRLRKMPDGDLLRVIDAVLHFGWNQTPVGDLTVILAASRSKWMVGERQGKPGLVARVPEGVQDMVEATIGTSGTAGQILARAWFKVHSLTADDPGAYADAVKAVERAAKPLVEPNNDDGTLSSIIGAMRDNGDWRLPLRENALAPTADTILAMCRTLWRGHSDRHATADDYRDVTHDEALAAVVLAATLVSWFSDGLIQRRP
jgi:hypothetical protein